MSISPNCSLRLSTWQRCFAVQNEGQQLRQHGRSRASAKTAAGRALSALQAHVLLAVEHEGHGRPHGAAKIGLDLEELLALVSAVGAKQTVGQDLKYQIACGGYRSTTRSSAALRVPAFRLGRGIIRH